MANQFGVEADMDIGREWKEARGDQAPARCRLTVLGVDIVTEFSIRQNAWEFNERESLGDRPTPAYWMSLKAIRIIRVRAPKLRIVGASPRL